MKQVDYLLQHVDELLMKKPFFRGGSSPFPDDYYARREADDVDVNTKFRAQIPSVKKDPISQAQYLLELDPQTHEIMFDENIPSVCMKLSNGTYKEMKMTRMGIPFQKRILEKQTLCLCGNNTIFTLRGTKQTSKSKLNFSTIKEYWEDRNMDGWRSKAIYAQKSQGDVGLLFYHNNDGETRCRLLTYKDGYNIISHNDDNGERILECVYYRDDYDKECIDCYDKTYLYQLRQVTDGWVTTKIRHGYSEIPLCTKRGDVAWNDVQSLINFYEIIYNILMVVQKKHGFGMLYIKGKFSENAKKIAGNIVLNDTSLDGSGMAEYLKAPTPDGMMETLQSLYEQIQIGSSTTFLLPKDIKSSGDVSALAIMLTQSLDIECASQGVIDWQNFISKMVRLFIEGLAKELVNSGENPNAITEFKKLKIGAKLKVWRPFNEVEYNSMLIQMKGAGIISTQTAVEKNTISTPDEMDRLIKEEEEKVVIDNNINEPIEQNINEQ